jgi:hypothetical protein
MPRIRVCICERLKSRTSLRECGIWHRTECNSVTKIGLACYQKNTPLGAVNYNNGSVLYVTIRFLLVINYYYCKCRTLPASWGICRRTKTRSRPSVGNCLQRDPCYLSSSYHPDKHDCYRSLSVLSAAHFFVAGNIKPLPPSPRAKTPIQQPPNSIEPVVPRI